MDLSTLHKFVEFESQVYDQLMTINHLPQDAQPKLAVYINVFVAILALLEPLTADYKEYKSEFEM